MNDPHILQTQLAAYASNGLYPMHMPGHKRQVSPTPDLAFAWDMTEVPGVDDLHEAKGILAQAMKRTAQLHGAARSWYLVNGSTCGLLAGIRALAPAGRWIIAARNCHKAVYHAVELGGLQVHWLMPPIEPSFGIAGSISPTDVADALAARPDAACVVLTSPTYEGVISDIAAIAQLCHSYGVPMLVDEAHGAHLGLAPGWPKSAVQLGADLVVQSAHKTLPSLTQTALLHLSHNSLANPNEVERQLDVFETSSPSYPLLASLDGCTGLLRENGALLFQQFEQELAAFDSAVLHLEKLRVLCHGSDHCSDHAFFRFDPSKLVICTAGAALSGSTLAQLLRERFRFETEMTYGDLCLGMSTLCDAPGILQKFGEALILLDQELSSTEKPRTTGALVPPGASALPIAQAVLRPSRSVPPAQATGQISAEYVWAYPPGIPLIAPGEEITDAFLAGAQALEDRGTQLHHSICKKAGCFQAIS